MRDRAARWGAYVRFYRDLVRMGGWGAVWRYHRLAASQSDTPSPVDASINVDARHMPALLRRISEAVADGFGAAQVDRVARRCRTLKPEQEARFTFQVTLGEPPAREMVVLVVAEDDDSRLLFVTGDNGIVEAARQVMRRFAQEIESEPPA